jgi:signal transduction histidine kinase
MIRLSPPRALILAGLGTWAVMAFGAARSGALDEPWAVGAWAAFAVAFLVAVTEDGPRLGWRRAALALQTVALLAATAAGDGRFAGVLLAVVAGQAPMLLPRALPALWCAAQTVAFGALLAGHVPTSSAVSTALGYAAFQLFALGAGWFAQREGAAREELARVNDELRAAQARLAETTRNAERLRISRELHDALGHHLTALSLHLELASNARDDRQREALVRARSLAGEMLAEVRSVVGTLREAPVFDLRDALGALVKGVPQPPRLELVFGDDVGPLDPAAAQALFRCAQEGLTNALRHAGASHIRIGVERFDSRVRVTVEDDGRAPSGEVAPGHGLRGLRERLHAVGGELHLQVGPEAGTTLAASVPA